MVGRRYQRRHERSAASREEIFGSLSISTLAIETTPGSIRPKPKPSIFSVGVEDGVDFEGRVSVEVKPEARLVEGLGLKFIEIFVFLRRLRLTFEPDRADGVVSRRPPKLGIVRKRNIFDDFDTSLLAKSLYSSLGNYDTSASTFSLDLLDLVSARSIARPAVAFTFGLPGGCDLDRIGNHEDGVKTDAELADEIIITLTAFLKCGEKSFEPE